MTQIAVSRARRGAHALAFVVPLLVATGVAGGCADTRRSIGESCLKDQDCVSGTCSQLVCVAAPPTTGVMADADSGVVAEAGEGEAAADTGGGADAPTASDAGGSGEAASDGGGD